MNVIIKSGKKKWSGKEFSDLPAKIYRSFEDATSAISTYHLPCERKQKIEIIHLTESNERKLLTAGKIRW